MAYEKLRAQPLDYMPCRYGTSKLLFRGPKRRLSGRYAAFLGGTETYGKFIETPFPALVEAQSGLRCVNLGWPNVGLDALLNETEILHIASRAVVTVLQVPGAQNLSNRYFSVHPRRNDRFVQASALLRDLYPDMDFTEFHFTRHMLHRLAQVSPQRFAVVRHEMQAAWNARLALLLRRIEAPVILLWMSAHRPQARADEPTIGADPALVTRSMLEKARRHADGFIDATISAAAHAAGTAGMVHSEFEHDIAAELPGPAAHAEVTAHLLPVIGAYA